MFGKRKRSEADLCLWEAEIRKGAVLSDPGSAVKFTDRTR